MMTGGRALCGIVFSVAVIAGDARAADEQAALDVLPSEPLNWMLDTVDVTLGGSAGGAVSYSSEQSGPADSRGSNRGQASGQLRSWVRVQQTLDNGMIFGIRTDVLIAHDHLSGDIFDSDTIERLFAFAQTGFGRLEIGEQDGAGYALALTGPEIDPQVSLEARTISLFRNPVTHRDFAQFFKQVTAVQTTSNYAKLNYLSPRLFGLQIGVSFTPQTVRTPLPWTGNPSNRPNTQQNIWEIATNYTGYISGVAVGVSAGYAQGSQRDKAPGGADLYDWSFGAELAYTIEDTKLTVGGAYRGTNAWLLDVTEVARGFATTGDHISATVERGPWRVGAETSSAHAAGPTDYTITGYQTTLGYQFTPALTLSAGWQWYGYARNNGLFFNGRPSIRMNAGYLGLAYSL